MKQIRYLKDKINRKAANCCLMLMAMVLAVTSTWAQTPTIGDDYHGGKVGYILQPGDPGYDASKIKGFVVGTADYTAAWATVTYQLNYTGVQASDIGTGASNTAALVNLMGPGNYLAYKFDTLTLGGYTDWYLPSQTEMLKIFQNYALLNISTINVGAFTQSESYLTSTEVSTDANTVYAAKYFSIGNPPITATNMNLKAFGRARPVRNFEISLCASTSSTTTITSRGKYGFNGVDYTTSGVYNYDTLVNAAGCDSILKLNLTIFPEITTNTVTIGSIEYATQNLNVTHYRNGDLIPEVTDATAWSNLTTGAWCWYNNDSANYAKYGRLYNWYAVNDSRGLAPVGYHISTVAENNNLTTQTSISPESLVASGINIWSNNTAGTNMTGFAAFPNGTRVAAGSFSGSQTEMWLWSSSIFASSAPPNSSYGGKLNWDGTKFVSVFFMPYNRKIGMSVRLVKDTCTPSTSTTTITNCGAYTWNGQTYDSTGTYTWTGTNAAGCDSTATLNLTISKPAGSEWTLQTVANPDPANNYIEFGGIAYGDGKFVVLKNDAINGGVMTSTDGINWTDRVTPANDESFSEVVYGNGLFVAIRIRSLQAVMTSPDGINWTLRSTPDNGSFNDWNSITYGNGLFVIVGSRGKSMYSSDGVNWSLGNIPDAFTSWNDVAYGNGVFVAVGGYNSNGGNLVITSTDGINWSYKTAAENNGWSAVTYGNGRFVALAATGNNRVMTSTDGTTWVSSSASASSWQDIIYADQKFLAVASNSAMTSPDGISWTDLSVPQKGWFSVAYGNNRFVASSTDATDTDIMTSIAGAACAPACTPTTSTTTITNCGAYTWNGQTYDSTGIYTWTGTNAAGCDSTATLNLTINKTAGTDWNIQTVANPNYIYNNSITYGNGLFVVVKEDGGTNGVMTSTDGINWTQQTTPDAKWEDVTYGNGLFVAVATSGIAKTTRIMTSPDGINWTLRTTPFNSGLTYWNSITYGNGLFVAVPNQGKSMSSPDGINWTLSNSDISANNWESVAYGNGLFVAVSWFIQSGTSVTDKIITSTDGINWTYRSTPLQSAYWSSVTYGNGRFVVISSQDQVITSTDGINWTSGTAAANNTWQDVTFGNGLFVAVSRSAATNVMTSPDGINWTLASAANTTTGRWCSIAYGNNRFVALGDDGGDTDIMTSIASAACELPCTPTTSITTVTSRGLYGWRGKDYTASGTYSDTLINPAGCEYIPSLNLTILPAITTDTVRIGDQTWTTNNLAISHYKNGDPIPQVTDKATWDNLTTGAWCWYNNDSVNYAKYGKLYNWYAVNDPRGFGLPNFRMPTVVEYNTLRQTTTKLAEFAQPGINVWNNDVRATNISGFGVYPLGLRNGEPGGSTDFNPNGESVDKWTSTAYPFSADSAIQVQLSFNSVADSLQYNALVSSKRMGLPVRLLACTPTTSSTTVISRGLYGWNGVDYTSTGTYQKVLVNATGCDSIATLNLTILPAITADTVRIYNQTWTTKNLNVTRYRNGDVIPQVTDSTAWSNLTTGAWCWYNNDSTNYAQYGRLYNWYAVNDPRGLAPKGYHVPTGNEALELQGNFPTDGNCFIAPGINIWDGLTSPGTDTTGFALYPSGLRYGTNITGNTDFDDVKKIGAFWLTDDYSIGAPAAFFKLSSLDSASEYGGNAALFGKAVGIPVRLIKDPCSPTTSDTAVSICSSYSWNGSTYTQSGTYTFSTTNAAGCDSTATLHLTIKQPTTSSNDVTSCDSYSWNGSTYTQSGTYTFNTTNAAGCDSTATLNLTINKSTTSTTDVTFCHSYSWNGSTYTQSGTYTFSTTNAAGCDSTATLNLTITPKPTWYKDADADGYGTGDSLTVCDQPTGYRLLKDMIAASGDCDDMNANIRPNSSTAATSILASSTAVTAGANVTLTVNGGSLGASDSWKWYSGSCGGTAIGSGTSIVVSPSVTTTYYLRAEGCTNTSCVSVTITACGPTGVTASAANNTICAGTSTTLTVQGVLSGAASWKWYKNACGYDESRSSTEGAIGSGSTLKVSPTATTTYYVRSEGGVCGKTICKSITITVNPKPSTPVTVSAPSKICKQSTIQLTVGEIKNATSYKWTVPAGWSIVSGQGTRTVRIKVGNASANVNVAAVNSCGTSANYAKKITVGNCTSTSSAVLVTTAMKPAADEMVDGTASLQIQAYPNPSTNQFTVRNNNSYVIQLRMIQVTGQVVDAFSQVQPGASVQFGAAYRPGIYLVEATGNGLKTTQKLIKQ